MLVRLDVSVSANRGRLQQVEALRRHADEVGDLLPLDQLEGPVGVPLVHDHELQAGRPARQHHGDATGDVEERHDEDERRRQPVSLRLGAALAAQLVERGLATEPHQRLHHGAVRRHRPLRAPGGARGVEDRRVVVWRDDDVRHRRTELADLLPPIDALGQWARRAHGEDAASEAGGGRVAALRPLDVGDQDGGPAVLEGVVELVGRPPGVQRDGDGPDRRDGRERDHPLRVVPHADRHAVTGDDPVAVYEERGERVDVGHHLGEAPPLVLVDEERRVAPSAGAGEDLAAGSGVRA